MKIHLNRGIDDLIFGMRRIEVEKIIGKPDRELIDSADENKLIWEYTDKKLGLTFYQNQGDRLGFIRSSNSDLIINDFKIIDHKIDSVLRQIHPQTDSWEIEDYDSFTTYFLESEWLIIYVEYDRVTGIEHGVTFKNGDEYDWPETSINL